ncbi:MAG: EndoU domain-containing protein [Phycisphaerales bacterium]|nr:EndoU domain-containing protein [Phycisphaerales bacterium]
MDRRGNWLWHATRVGDPNLPAAETTRTLPTGGPAGTGGKANEYGRVPLVAAGQPIDHELVYDAAGNLVRVDVVGDLNCDGEVTFDDLDAFMLALTDPSGYAQSHPDCRLLLGDVNGDGQLTFDDIDYWVAFVGVSAVAADRYEYDQENRLTAVRDPDGVLKLRIWYDALGRRILSETYDASGDPVTTTRHIYDGLAAIVEFECAGAAAPIGEPNGCGDGSQPVLAREFIWGDRFPEPLVLIDRTDAGDVPAGQPEHLYFVHNALGSVVGLTNDPAALDPNYPGAGGPGGGSGSGGSGAGAGGGSGGGSGGGTGGGSGGGAGIMPALVERYDYDPYGATYIACRDPNTYDDAGETRDPHLLTDSAAWQPCESSRFGNPFLWTAQRYDPAVRLYHFLFRTYSPTLGRWMQRDPLRYIDSMNIYQYVGSMPTYYVDPLGLTYRSYVMDRLIDEEIARRRVHADNARDFIGAGAAATVCVVDGVLTTLVAGVLIGVPDPTDAVLVAALSKQGMRLIQRGGQWVLQKRGWLWGWRAANTASDADRLRKAVQEARAAYKHKVTPGRRTHILDGDATGGGHRAGTGRPSKTEFPDCWSDDYIKDLIEDIANGKLGTCVTRPDGRKECKALVDGYEILVVVENEDTGMHIVTAYPLRNAVRAHPSAVLATGRDGSWPVVRWVRRASAIVRSGSWPRSRRVR